LAQRGEPHRAYTYADGEIGANDYRPPMRLPDYQRELDLVTVTPDGTIAAYVNGRINPAGRIGDFGPVGTRPAYRRQGLARAALLEGLRRMKARGMERVCLSTRDTNTPARRLYESIGFRTVGLVLEFEKTGGQNHSESTHLL